MQSIQKEWDSSMISKSTFWESAFESADSNKNCRSHGRLLFGDLELDF